MSGFRVLAGVGPTLAFENPVEVLRDGGDADAALATAQERLSDGAWSPLYSTARGGALRRLVVLATAALEPVGVS